MSVKDKISYLRFQAGIFDAREETFAAISLNEYADILEAQEKAEPVIVVEGATTGVYIGGVMKFRYLIESKSIMRAGDKLYTHAEPPKQGAGTELTQESANKLMQSPENSIVVEPPTTPTGVAQPEDSKVEPVLWVNGDDLELLDCVGITAVRHSHPGKTKGYFNVPLYVEPPTGVTQVQAIDERAEFEKLVVENYANLGEPVPENLFKKCIWLPGHYGDEHINTLFIGWGMRAKLGQTTGKACSVVVPDGWIDAVKEIAGSHTNNEITDRPVWWIIDPRQILKPSVHEFYGTFKGPFFSREAATEYMESHRYRYGKHVKVYCGSCNDAPQFKKLYDISAAMLKGEK